MLMLIHVQAYALVPKSIGYCTPWPLLVEFDGGAAASQPALRVFTPDMFIMRLLQCSKLCTEEQEGEEGQPPISGGRPYIAGKALEMAKTGIEGLLKLCEVEWLTYGRRPELIAAAATIVALKALNFVGWLNDDVRRLFEF